MENLTEVENMARVIDGKSLTIYIPTEKYSLLTKEVEFENVPKTGSKNSKINAALDFYLELEESTKDIEDFGPDRTTDYIVKKIIDEHKKRTAEEKKYKNY